MAYVPNFQRLPSPLMETVVRTSYSAGPLAHLAARRIRNFATADLSALDASKGNRERIIILGSGWAGRVCNIQTHIIADVVS